MDYRKTMLDAAEKHCKITGKSRATIATEVMNHGGFFDRIESGGGCTIDTFQKVMNWFSENMPAEPEQKHTTTDGEEYANV